MDRTRTSALIFIAVVSIIRLAYTGWFELSLDEGYYWLWSKYPSASYYDHPPMVAWLIATFGYLGESERIVRAAAVFCAAVSSWFVYLCAREIFNDGKAALSSVVLLNVLPVFALGAVIITPDSPLFMFWAITLYFGARLVNTQLTIYWYAVGFFFGLAMLSKYTAALFAPALLVFLILSAENRAWLFRKEPYLAFGLSMVMFAPVIIWNAQRDWISFRFQLSHGFSGENPGMLLTMGEFWGGQVAITGVFLFFFMMVAVFAVAALGAQEKRDDYLYLGVITISLLAFFIINSARSRMEGNWAAPMYISAIVAAPFMVNHLSAIEGWKGRLAGQGYKLALWFSLLFIVYGHIQIVEPVFPMPQKHEISRRVFGWKALASETDKRMEGLGENPFIVSNRYQIATLLTYYSKDHTQAYITNGKDRFGYLGSVSHLVGSSAVYVTETERDDMETVGRYFDSVEKSGILRIERHGELIREFTFYKCYNYRGGLIQI